MKYNLMKICYPKITCTDHSKGRVHLGAHILALLSTKIVLLVTYLATTIY
jgi:hypothetical protein